VQGSLAPTHVCSAPTLMRGALVSPRQIPELASAGWRRLRRTFVALTGWMRRPADASGPEHTASAPAGDRGDARSRFWSEFRAGQREAEARIARRIP